MVHRLVGELEGCHRELPLTGAISSLGRHEDNRLVLPAPGVSRHHAVILQSGEGFRIEDRGSRNGTFVNDRRVETSALRTGDEIRLGPVRLLFEAVEEDDSRLGLALTPPPAGSSPGLQPGASWPATPLLRAVPSPSQAASRLAFPTGFVRGTAPTMEALYRELAAVADSDLPVILTGETGAGKEHLAHMIHGSSRRRGGPFVAVNGAALPSELMEAEMFGIGRGVATGVEARDGLLRRADGGTLFLDEVGELSPPLQAKLLRALEEGVIQPLGQPPVPVDVRLVSATNADLEKRLEDGSFRRDLYYRLAGAVLRVPPLRRRRRDLPALIEHFAGLARQNGGNGLGGFSVKALEVLTAYPWPGNLRELKHEIFRLAQICAEGQVVGARLLQHRFRAPSPRAESPAEGSLRLAERVGALEERLIRRALERTGGNRSHAAELLGISRQGLLLKLKRLGIS